MTNPDILDYQRTADDEASRLLSGVHTPDWQASRLDSGVSTPTSPPRGSDTTGKPLTGFQRPHLFGAGVQGLLTESVIAGLSGNSKRTDGNPPGLHPDQFIDGVNKLTDGRQSPSASPPAGRHRPVRSSPPNGLGYPSRPSDGLSDYEDGREITTAEGLNLKSCLLMLILSKTLHHLIQM